MGSACALLQTETPQYIRRILEPLIDVDRLTYFVIRGDGLDLFEWGGAPLMEFVRHQLEANANWAVVFQPHSDQIDRVERRDVEATIEALKANLKREAQRQGFVVASLPRASR